MKLTLLQERLLQSPDEIDERQADIQILNAADDESHDVNLKTSLNHLVCLYIGSRRESFQLN